MSSIYAAAVTQMAQAGLRGRHEDSSAARAYPERHLPERMNQARCWVCPESFHEESNGIGPAPIMNGELVFDPQSLADDSVIARISPEQTLNFYETQS